MNRHWAFQESTVPRRHVVNNKTTKIGPTSPGVARTFFRLRYYYYVNVTVSFTLRYRSVRSDFRFRFRLRYVTVAGVKGIAARV